MNLSELIERLETKKNDYGDRGVRVLFFPVYEPPVELMIEPSNIEFDGETGNILIKVSPDSDWAAS